jgi:hypothetical protein
MSLSHTQLGTKILNPHVSVTIPMKTRKCIGWDKEISAYLYAEVTGTVTLEINIEAVLEDLGAKALANKTGKAMDLCGLVRATATNRRQTALAPISRQEAEEEAK